jgi:hypothetical protein
LTIGNKQDKRYPGITVTVTRNYYMKHSQQSKAISSVSEEKDIGVTFDSKLSFDQHIAAKVKKAKSMVGTIRRSYQFLDNKSFIILYKTLVRCHFDYATSIWSPYLVRHRDIIEGVQRRATKMLPGFKDLEYPERLKRLQLPTMVYRRLRSDMVEVYKLMHGLYDDQVALTLTHAHRQDTRGNSYKLYKDKFNKKIRQ